MTTKFNYQTASIEEIVQQFSISSKQVIYNVRKYYKDDSNMTEKLSLAYLQYKIAKVTASVL